MTDIDELKDFVDTRIDDEDAKRHLMHKLEEAEGSNEEDLSVEGTFEYRVLDDDGNVKDQGEYDINEDLNTSGGD